MQKKNFNCYFLAFVLRRLAREGRAIGTYKVLFVSFSAIKKE